MKVKSIGFSIVVLLLGGLLNCPIGPAAALDDLVDIDFGDESWSASIDLIEYARRYAEEHGKRPPPEDWSSGIRLNYINLQGVKVLYAGFEGVDMGVFSITLPLQAFVEYFNTSEGLHAVTASSFLMVLAYNETDESLFPNSPDVEDRLWASFNIGRDLKEFFGDEAPQRLSGGVEVTPLTHTEDKREWGWGMRYTNLTAVWWALEMREDQPGYNQIPVAFSVYDELAFEYRLVFSPDEGRADLYLSYTIGEMRDLWIISHLGLLPMLAHYTEEGCFVGWRHKVSNETIHDFLRKNDIDISLVLFQRNLVMERGTVNTADGEDVTDTTVDVSSGSIVTFADTGEKIFEVNFGTKENYVLHNSTSGAESEHGAVTRTSEIQHYANNPVLKIQTSLLRFMPWLVMGMVPSDHRERVEDLLNITRVDYLYITSYPVFEGYEIEHDPVMTAYLESPETAGKPQTMVTFLQVFSLGTIGAVVILILIRRRQ